MNAGHLGTLWGIGLLLVSVGCGRLVFTPAAQQPLTLDPQQQQQLAMQTQEIQERATRLDQDNQELESLLAQSRQQARLLEEQLVATQDQLRGTADQLASLQTDNDQLRTRTQALAASVQRQVGAEIRSNNSLLRNLRITEIPGVEVKQDGDVIRIELRGDQVFYPGTSQIRPGAAELLQNVSSDVLRNYPRQLIGIEGHVDNSAPTSPQLPSGHHLSIAQATSVYDAVTRTVGRLPGQLFVIGHGSNHPLASNATEEGRQKNRRIEIVVYPETARR